MSENTEALIAEMKAAAELSTGIYGNQCYSKAKATKARLSFFELATEENILALIAALEQSEKQCESWKQLAQMNISEREKDVAQLDTARKRIAELEASQLAVKLEPRRFRHGESDYDDGYVNGWNARMEEDTKSIIAAGGTVQGDE